MSSATRCRVENTNIFFFFSSRRRHTRYWRDWSSDVCSSDLLGGQCAQRSVVLTFDDGSDTDLDRSEERRVGKECRSRWAPHQTKKKRAKRNDHRHDSRHGKQERGKQEKQLQSSEQNPPPRAE